MRGRGRLPLVCIWWRPIRRLRAAGCVVRDINGKSVLMGLHFSLCVRGVGFGLRFGEVLEVGVLEAGRVFEAVAEEAIEGDVGCPDEGDGRG